MNPQKRKALIDRIAAPLAASKEGEVVVPLELFLDGNDDDASFASNVFGGIAEPASALREIAARDDVDGVYVEIVDAMEEDDEAWPYADCAYVITTADPDELAEDHFPDSPPVVEVVPPNERPQGVTPPPRGYQLVTFWWD